MRVQVHQQRRRRRQRLRRRRLGSRSQDLRFSDSTSGNSRSAGWRNRGEKEQKVCLSDPQKRECVASLVSLPSAGVQLPLLPSLACCLSLSRSFALPRSCLRTPAPASSSPDERRLCILQHQQVFPSCLHPSSCRSDFSRPAPPTSPPTPTT